MKFILTILILFTLSALAADKLKPTPYAKAEQSIGKGKPTFLVFGAKYCPSCLKMGESLYNIKEENEHYNINYINLDENRSVIKKFEIRAIPMQIIYDENGTEVYDNLGLIKEDELNELFQEYGF